MNSNRYPFREFLSRFIDSPDDCQIFSILNALPAVSVTGPWIAGGAIRKTLQDIPLDSDVDFFFRDAEQKQLFDVAIKEKGGWKISEKEHVTNYGVRLDSGVIVIQAVTLAYYSTLEAVLDSFDFTITQFGFDGTDLVCGEFSLWDLARKKLALHRLTFGVSTVRRLIKYTKQGFTACSGVLADILEQTIADPSVVHREVTYVD